MTLNLWRLCTLDYIGVILEGTIVSLSLMRLIFPEATVGELPKVVIGLESDAISSSSNMFADMTSIQSFSRSRRKSGQEKKTLTVASLNKLMLTKDFFSFRGQKSVI